MAIGHNIIKWHKISQITEWLKAICSTAIGTLLACQPIQTNHSRHTRACLQISCLFLYTLCLLVAIHLTIHAQILTFSYIINMAVPIISKSHILNFTLVDINCQPQFKTHLELFQIFKFHYLSLLFYWTKLQWEIG